MRLVYIRKNVYEKIEGITDKVYTHTYQVDISELLPFVEHDSAVNAMEFAYKKLSMRKYDLFKAEEGCRLSVETIGYGILSNVFFIEIAVIYSKKNTKGDIESVSASELPDIIEI